MACSTVAILFIVVVFLYQVASNENNRKSVVEIAPPSSESPVMQNPQKESVSLPAEPAPIIHKEAPVVIKSTPETPLTPPNHFRRPPVARLLAPKTKAIKTLVQFGAKANQSTRNLANEEQSVLNPPFLNWKPVSGAVTYLLQIASDSEFKNLLISKEIDEPFFIWEKPIPGTSFWRVKSKGQTESESEFSLSSAITVLLPRPVFTKTQFIFETKGKNTLDDKYIITWNPVPLAIVYLISTSSFGSMKTKQTIGFSNEANFRLNKLNVGTHFFQVEALDQLRRPASLPSQPVKVEIRQALNLLPPTLMQPQNNTTVPSQGTMITPIACRWSLVKQAANYNFQLSADPKFGKLIHEATIPGNQYVITIPLSKGKYFWRVRSSLDQERISDWTNPNFFVMD